MGGLFTAHAADAAVLRGRVRRNRADCSPQRSWRYIPLLLLSVNAAARLICPDAAIISIFFWSTTDLWITLPVFLH